MYEHDKAVYLDRAYNNFHLKPEEIVNALVISPQVVDSHPDPNRTEGLPSVAP
jgi:hypothetical protein